MEELKAFMRGGSKTNIVLSGGEDDLGWHHDLNYDYIEQKVNE